MPLYQEVTVSAPVATFCSYKLKAIKYAIRWSIKDFNSLVTVCDEALMSPTFHLGNNDELEVRISYYPKGDVTNENRNGDTRSAIYLLPSVNKTFQGPITGIVRFAMFNQNNAIIASEVMPISDRTMTPGLGWGLKEWGYSLKQMTATSSYLFSGSFVVHCEVSLDITTIMSGLQPSKQLKIAESNLLKDFCSLLRSEEYSDVTLIAGDQSFKAHKAILSARSPVFNAMFRQEMAETQTNVVNISDVEADVLRDILLFVYTGKMASLDGIEEELLIAAEKYQLEDLKAMCEEYLVSTLTVENSCHFLVLADIYQARHLKASAAKFINQHKSQVTETEGWNLARKKHPHVLVLAFL